MMGEYITLTGGGDLLSTLGQFSNTLINFLQTPGGWFFMAMIVVLFYVFKRQ